MPRHRRPVAAGDEADPHRALPPPRSVASARGTISCARWLSRDSSRRDEPVVADLAQRREHAGQVDVALVERQVLVHAAAHALDGDGAEVRREGAHGLGRLVRPRDDAVAGVERERDARARRRRARAQSSQSSTSIPGSGSTAQGVRAGRRGESTSARTPSTSQVARLGRGRRPARGTPAQNDTASAPQHVGEVAGAAQEVEPPRAALGGRR